MYRIWYWATVDRESDGRFIASIPDLGDLAAYGDTDSDVPMLNLAENPVAEYPSAALRKAALANGWRILEAQA